MSLILFTVEGLLPPLFLPPGAKFGLANVVTVVALYKLSEVDALIILSARIFLAGMFAGSPTVIFFSISGGLLSLAAMILLGCVGKIEQKKHKQFFDKMSLKEVDNLCQIHFTTKI